MNFTIETHTIVLKSKGDCDIINITNKIQDIIEKNNFIEGSAVLFVPGSTAGITTIEYEPGLLKDYPIFLKKSSQKIKIIITMIPGTMETDILTFGLLCRVHLLQCRLKINR
jgi:hypothetical protein